MTAEYTNQLSFWGDLFHSSMMIIGGGGGGRESEVRRWKIRNWKFVFNINQAAHL